MILFLRGCSFRIDLRRSCLTRSFCRSRCSFSSCHPLLRVRSYIAFVLQTVCLLRIFLPVSLDAFFMASGVPTLSAFLRVFLVIGRCRQGIGAGKPMMQVDIGATPRAERPHRRRRGLAADGANADRQTPIFLPVVLVVRHHLGWHGSTRKDGQDSPRPPEATGIR